MTTTPTSTIRELLDKAKPVVPDREPTRVITVRLPKSLHLGLREISHTLRKSMNAFCVDALQAQALASLDALEADLEHPDAIE